MSVADSRATKQSRSLRACDVTGCGRVGPDVAPHDVDNVLFWSNRVLCEVHAGIFRGDALLLVVRRDDR